MNSATITGRLVADPELRTTGKGEKMVKFTVAVDRETSEQEADFIKCVAFGHSAEFLAGYCKKADTVGIVGKIRTGSYEEKDTGRKVYTTDIFVNRVERLHAYKPKTEYPSAGTPVYTADIQPEPGVSDDGEELPF